MFDSGRTILWAQVAGFVGGLFSFGSVGAYDAVDGFFAGRFGCPSKRETFCAFSANTLNNVSSRSSD